MKTVTTKKLSNDVKEFVIRVVGEVLNDPDFGMNLTEETKRKLRQASNFDGKTISLNEIEKKYL
jgi:hypothetical protein